MYREIPRFGTRSTNRWYLSYHSVVLVVPKLGTCPTNAWYDKYQRVGRTQRLGVWPVIPCCFIFLLPDFYVFFPVRFFFSYSAAIRKCTECPKTDTLLFALTLVFNDLCFWHGFGKYKGEESQAVRLRNRTAAT
jgi:hypothetical protein